MNVKTVVLGTAHAWGINESSGTLFPRMTVTETGIASFEHTGKYNDQ